MWKLYHNHKKCNHDKAMMNPWREQAFCAHIPAVVQMERMRENGNNKTPHTFQEMVMRFV